MIILERTEALKLWSSYWQDMEKEWFKVEVLQDYSGEDDCPSLHAWVAGDKQKSLELLKQTPRESWFNKCKEKTEQGVLMRRVRIVEKPHTPYTEWEIEFYRHVNMPGGEQIFIVDKQDVEDLHLPTGDLMMFDNRRVAICEYDKNGRMVGETFYDENDDSTKLLQLKHDLLASAQQLHNHSSPSGPRAR